MTTQTVARPSSSGAGGALPEAVMPDLCSAYQVGVFAERGERELRLLVGNEAAALCNHFAKVFEAHAFHDAAAHHDSLRHKQIDQVSQAQPQIVHLALDCFAC